MATPIKISEKDIKTLQKTTSDLSDFLKRAIDAGYNAEEARSLRLKLLSVHRVINHAHSRYINEREDVRQRQREKKRQECFSSGNIVYEASVEDIYESLYATDYKELRKKMSKYANFHPKEKDMAVVNTWINGELTKTEIWCRQNTKAADGKITPGTWECGEVLAKPRKLEHDEMGEDYDSSR